MAKKITKTPAIKMKAKRKAPLRKRLDKIVAEMVNKGIQLPEAQDQLDAVIAVVEAHGIPGAKAAAAAAGLVSSAPRRPLESVPDDVARDIATAVGIAQRT